MDVLNAITYNGRTSPSEPMSAVGAYPAASVNTPNPTAPGSPMSSAPASPTSANAPTISWLVLVLLALGTRVFIEKTGAKVD